MDQKMPNGSDPCDTSNECRIGVTHLPKKCTSNNKKNPSTLAEYQYKHLNFLYFQYHWIWRNCLGFGLFEEKSYKWI